MFLNYYFNVSLNHVPNAISLVPSNNLGSHLLFDASNDAPMEELSTLYGIGFNKRKKKEISTNMWM